MDTGSGVHHRDEKLPKPILKLCKPQTGIVQSKEKDLDCLQPFEHLANGHNMLQRREVKFDLPVVLKSSYEVAREGQRRGTSSGLFDDLILPPAVQKATVLIPEACYSNPLLSIFQVVTPKPLMAQIHIPFHPHKPDCEYWHVVPFSQEALQKNPSLRTDLLQRLHHVRLLRKVDPKIRDLLPLAVHIWYDQPGGLFYLASQLPKGSSDLASSA